MQQDYTKPDPNKRLHSTGVAEWVRSISAEWRILFGTSNITELTPQTFNPTIFGQPEGVAKNTSWFVLFTDGITCGPCRTAKTNLMRLGSSSAGLGLRVAFVNCKQHRNFCKTEHAAPKSPHAPFIKAWPRSSKQRERNREGVMLYNVNSVESHVAIEIVAKVVQLLAHEDELEDALA